MTILSPRLQNKTFTTSRPKKPTLDISVNTQKDLAYLIAKKQRELTEKTKKVYQEVVRSKDHGSPVFKHKIKLDHPLGKTEPINILPKK